MNSNSLVVAFTAALRIMGLTPFSSRIMEFITAPHKFENSLPAMHKQQGD
jgi:hypothetical protein